MSNNEPSRRRTEEASPLHDDQKALNELGISSSTWQQWEKSFQEESDPPCSTSRSISYVIIGGLVSFNLVAFISLYPVLRGRGAPYLPSKRSQLDNMFQQLKQDSDFRKLIDNRQKLSFVDLGSGDGRVVFRAAREDIFHTATGYEINPMLHGFAQIRRMISPKYWRTTRFGIADIWKINLADVDVIAVVRSFRCSCRYAH